MAAIRSEVDIRQDVLDALNHDVRLDASGITVDVAGGVVYLRGIVPSFYEKQVAAEDAQRIQGVAEVLNELRVAPTVARTDEQITNDVRSALDRDVRLDANRIAVETTNGVVYLSGTVDSYADKFAADDDAWKVRGVLDVVNSIVVQPATTRTDDEIRADVRRALDRDARVDATRIAVDVHDGVVRLRGAVPTADQRLRASDDAWQTAGVRNVQNELAVIP